MPSPASPTVQVRVPLRSLDMPPGRRFYAVVGPHAPRERPVPPVCFDRVPGSGMLPVPLG